MRLVVLAVSLAASSFGQSQEAEHQNIPALLSEVHQLRLAIERSTLLGTLALAVVLGLIAGRTLGR